MSEPANPKETATRPDAEGEKPPPPLAARPSDDDGPHAGASLDLPLSSPD